MNWQGILEGATQVKPVLECAAILVGFLALVKWLRERSDRASDVLLELETQFQEKCAHGRPLLENESQYRSIEPLLKTAAQESLNGSKQVARQTDIDNFLRFYVVLYALRRERQVSDRALSICYRYWLAHYYRRDRQGFRSYVHALYPTLSRWLHTDRSWWRRFLERPWSPWWRSFFRPCDFWPPADLER